MLWLFVGPTEFACWISFAPLVRFCLLLGPCLCFVSFLCLGLCVLGDDALMGWRSFMQAKHLGPRLGWGWGLCAVGPVWALWWSIFTGHSGQFFFCGSFVLFMFCVCVLIHIWAGGEVGAPSNWFKPSSKIFY